MTVLAPDRLAAALAALASEPAPTVLAGGTDLMVELNYGLRRPIDVLGAGEETDVLRAVRAERMDLFA